MRPYLRALIVLLLVAGIAAGIWGYAYRRQLRRQWACYQVGAAASPAEAQRRMAWFEAGADRAARLEELVRKWGTGNRRFDLYLAQYVARPESSELLRATFSAELSRRDELLPRWAHYWAHQAPLEPDEQIASILRYLDALASADRPRRLTWRQALNLQAVWELLGQRELARGLTPEDWQTRYRRWRQIRPTAVPRVPRPASPFPQPSAGSTDRPAAEAPREAP